MQYDVRKDPLIAAVNMVLAETVSIDEAMVPREILDYAKEINYPRELAKRQYISWRKRGLSPAQIKAWMKRRQDEKKTSLDEANSFHLLPSNVISNELYTTVKILNSIEDSLRNGNDFPDKEFGDLINKLQKIRKEAKQFKPGEEIPLRFQFKSK